MVDSALVSAVSGGYAAVESGFVGVLLFVCWFARLSSASCEQKTTNALRVLENQQPRNNLLVTKQRARVLDKEGPARHRKLRHRRRQTLAALDDNCEQQTKNDSESINRMLRTYSARGHLKLVQALRLAAAKPPKTKQLTAARGLQLLRHSTTGNCRTLSLNLRSQINLRFVREDGSATVEVCHGPEKSPLELARWRTGASSNTTRTEPIACFRKQSGDDEIYDAIDCALHISAPK